VISSLSSPGRDDNIAFRADWLELAAILTPRTPIGTSSLTDGFDIDVETDEDPEAEEIFRLDYTGGAIGEIGRRSRLLKDAYPFELNPLAETLTFTDRLIGARAIYVFCLLVTASRNTDRYGHLRVDLGTNNEMADLFQICATIAAAGFMQGPSVSFGWPRPDDAPFLAALSATLAQLDEGQARTLSTLAPGASTSPKDAGIDVIAWSPSLDGYAGKNFMLGQSASGNNWRHKSVKEFIPIFYHFWTAVNPVSEPTPALFIPTPLELNLRARDHEFERARHDDFEGRTKEFGVIFDRHRLVSSCARALILIAENTLKPEDVPRAAELSKIEAVVRGIDGSLAA
jgi:hypothetical protein